MKPVKSVDEYIRTFPKDVQDKLESVRKLIKEEVEEGVETISYGIPTIKLNGKYVVYFAGYKTHISIYPVLEAVEKAIPEVSRYRAGKGTLHFSMDKPLPLPFIRKVVKVMLQENIKRTKNKSS